MMKILRFVEWLGLALLRLSGTRIVIYPIYMDAYRDEILALCRAEEAKTLHTEDVLGAGYFKGRRVMSQMRAKYPHLSVRDLWQAVDIISREC